MARRSAKAATSTDKTIGSNIRIRRLQLGVTQQQLAKKLGVTFQQVQKYEKGVNRVGSGRLYQIATILEAPIGSFFSEGGRSTKSASSHSSPYDSLQEPMTLQMLNAFSKVKDRKNRWALLTLIEHLASLKQRNISARL
ncbi:MAG TPA: helix-turn-helix transcriptional regulator [Xanthobacteraceae bacterium]|jgi:transcriptional regulator with XRE-family HTH domain|nr:helix-turn-helix transcriptional regulator [Xanthobacteraceae bacterium]